MKNSDENQKLIDYFKDYKKVVVAFSGGIDSTVVLYAAYLALGRDNVISVVVDSDLYSPEEFVKAKQISKKMGVKLVTPRINYLEDEQVRNNTPDSWYYAKKLFYDKIEQIRKEEDADIAFDGMNEDDNDDYRPGFKARDEYGVLSPLQICKFHKTEVRAFAKEHGLKNWNKVSSCSVSSRFPYNTPLTRESVDQVINSENFLRDRGFLNVRVRYYGDTARIEVPADQISQLFEIREEVYHKLQDFGFTFVAIDIGGFKSGNMNKTLSQKQLLKYKNY